MDAATPRRPRAADGPVLLAVLVAVLLFVVAARSPGSSSAAATSDLLVVADLRGQALVVVDPAAPEAARRIPVPGGPHELLRLPDGRVVASLEQSGALAFVDLATGEVERREIGGRPHGLVLQPDGILLVTDRDAEAVRRFVLQGGEELAPLRAEGWPHAVALGPAGEVVVALARADAVQIDTLRLAAPHLSETVAIAPDGRIATAGALDGVVVVFDRDGHVLERYQVGGRPVRVMFDASGDRLAVALSAAGAVAVIEDGWVQIALVAGVPDGLAFSPDGRWLYASDVYGGAVSVVDLDTVEVAAVIEVGAGTGAILVRPAE